MMRDSKPALSSQSHQGIHYVANASICQLLPSRAVKTVWKMFGLSPVEEADFCQAGLEIHLSVVLSKQKHPGVYIFKWLYGRKITCTVMVMPITKE